MLQGMIGDNDPKRTLQGLNLRPPGLERGSLPSELIGTENPAPRAIGVSESAERVTFRFFGIQLAQS